MILVAGLMNSVTRPLYVIKVFYFYTSHYIRLIIFTLFHIIPFLYVYSSARNISSSLIMPLIVESVDSNFGF